MPQVFPDFSEAMDFGPGPEDIYEGRIINVDMETAETGTPYIAVRYTLYGERAVLNKVDKRQLTRNYMLKGKGSGFLKRFLAAAKVADGVFRDTDQLIGRLVMVATTNETYEGEVQMRVKTVMPHPAQAPLTA